ncbi:hypothetical protein [Nocardia ignorata]|uniref:Uncharacterized protein n=1 Tax=Nocardia ignorata TaxID=145285 RepID=A0A4R6PRW9_NOCIG|nr:hypothetical protein [Nocardia ignorata]TDP39772.1 hypothetical protein DFR75_102491 [Nocardia ignorata]
MRETEPTEAEIRQNFDKMLASVLSGGGIHSETGLDMKTEDALWQVARAYPNASDDLVQAARAAFAGQLDGSNAREADLVRQRRLADLAKKRR